MSCTANLAPHPIAGMTPEPLLVMLIVSWRTEVSVAATVASESETAYACRLFGRGEMAERWNGSIGFYRNPWRRRCRYLCLARG